MHRKGFALLLLCSVHAVIHAQDRSYVDSLVTVLETRQDTGRLKPLHELYMEYLYTDHEKAKAFLDEFLSIAKTAGDQKQLALGTNLLGVYYNVTSKYKEGIRIFQEAKALYEALGDQERVSALLNNMSIANRNMGNLDEALENQMASLAIKEDIGVDDEALAASYWNIGNIHGDIQNYAESNTWYRKAEQIYATLGLEDDRIDVRYNLALNLRDMDSLQVAMPMFQEALAHYRMRNFNNSVAGSLDNLGNIARSQGALDQAEVYYREALEISLTHGEQSLPGLLYRRLARVAQERNQPDKALEYARNALTISRQTGVRKKMITDYLIMSGIFEELHHQDSALAYYKDYHALNDSVFAEEKIIAMNELEVKYQAEKKDQEIQLLNEQAKRATLLQQSLIGAIAGLVVLILALVYGIRQRIRRNKLEKEKLDAELGFKKRELSAFALQLAQKNEVLKIIQGEISGIKQNSETHRDLGKINRKIDQTLTSDTNWDQFLQRFEAVHQGYQQKVITQFPEITPNDLRLMALIKMHLSSKEIANILNLSNEGIKKARYRLRKKLGIETTVPLDAFVTQLF